MRLKELQSHLEDLAGFENPKVELEQYVTSPHFAAQMLFAAEAQYGDIENKSVCDLGCGCGILGVAAMLQGASLVIGIDTDPDALKIARENIDATELENEVDLVCARLADLTEEDVGLLSRFNGFFDTVVMNPPYGTKTVGADMLFLQHACRIANTAVYSLHKTSTREHIKKRAVTWGFKGEVLAQLKYDLPKTMKFHKARSKDIEVDFWRFERQ